jgi:hypothetical protein
MGPILGWWKEQGRLALDPLLEPTFAGHLAHARRRAAGMYDHARDIVAALAARGIVPTVLKGGYTAHQYFTDAGVRPGTDIDLLILAGDVDRVHGALRSLGLEQLSVQTLPYREDWGIPGQTVRSMEMTHEANPWTVDLHVSLDRQYSPGVIAGFGVPDERLLEAWHAPFGPVRILSQPLLTAHLAVHGGSDFPNMQLIRVVELIFVLRKDLASGRLTWERLGAMLKRTGTGRFAYPALALAAQLSPDTVDPAFVQTLGAETTRRMRRALGVVARTPPQHFGRLSFDFRFAWTRGPREILLAMLDLVHARGPQLPGRTRLRVWRRRLKLLLTGRLGWRA